MVDSNKFSFYESPPPPPSEKMHVYQTTSSVVDEVEITSVEVSEEEPYLGEFIEVVEEERIELGSVVFSSAASQENNGNECEPMVTEPCKGSSVVDNDDNINGMQPEGEVTEETFSDCISMVTEPSKSHADHTADPARDDVQPTNIGEEAAARNDVDVIAADVENRPSCDNDSIEVNRKEATAGPAGKVIEITSNTSNLSLGGTIASANSGDSSLPSVERTPSLEKGVFRIDNLRALLQTELTRGEYSSCHVVASYHFKCPDLIILVLCA